MSKFTATIRAKGAAMLQKAETARQLAITKLADRVIDATPVGAPETWAHGAGMKALAEGYKPGHAKANWQGNVGTPITTELTDGNMPYPGPVDPEGVTSKLNIRSNLGGGDCTVHITNNVPYARALENGRSGQAPNGMVKLAAADWKNIVKEAATQAGL